ncbi:DUF397 domain-containing protein [Actinokineospora soli]|uniref:DUF397 domain-containing protein n=1 Tax=Actinokineospora soli TaxID=1048753 RepID=A0ABW2TYE6_9PSEU
MATEWRKSSFSSTAGNCVEVAFAQSVGVRDSKNTEPTLTFPVESWKTFLSSPN